MYRLEIVSNFSVIKLYCHVKRSPPIIISHIWTGEDRDLVVVLTALDDYIILLSCTNSVLYYSCHDDTTAGPLIVSLHAH